jgi:lysophospholipid acyltransferase (LPLAT)-like uncharacterized protein
MTRERKAALIAGIGSAVMRLWNGTLRWRFIDHAGVMSAPPARPQLLWVFWHNRLFVMAYMFEKVFRGRPGAALASASKDGAIIAAIMEKFGIRAIRGSSSRRGAVALVEMKRAIERGEITALTPDGPRGPCYRVSGGAIKLAQVTDGLVLPLHVRISSCWRLKSWDGFMIPKPFARVEITFGPAHRIAATASDEEFEAERLKLEHVMQAGAGD